MAEAPKPKKKVVKVQSPKKAAEPGAEATGTAKGQAPAKPAQKEPAWTPSAENKKKATTFRIIAWIAWIAAIALEIWAIVFLLKQDPIKVGLLIVALAVIGVLAIAGNLLWKQANRLDPASESNKTKFWIQNQLGAIMTVIAFLPLVVLVFTDKNMSGKHKGIVGGIGVVAMVAIALLTGADFDAPSQEQYAAEENIIVQLTGVDEVFWTKSGSVFHVCAAVPDVNKESADGNIYQGTVAQAHEAGKDRITKRWPSEAVNYCGISQEKVDEVQAGLAADGLPELTDELSDTEQSE